MSKSRKTKLKKYSNNEIIISPDESSFSKPLTQKTVEEVMREGRNVQICNNICKEITKTDDNIVVLTRKNLPNNAVEGTFSVSPCLKKKKDYLSIIKQKLEDGKTQEQIAEELGISQSYVSKLLKDK
nr:MAG TPA: RNA polymerase sigma-70 factor [Caudoviricetes sp.]